MDITQECSFCNLPVDDSKPTVVLRGKGCDTINRTSKDRLANIHVVPGQIVHTDCRRDFIHPRNSSSSKCDTNNNNNYVTRSVVTFDFENTCIFCGHHAKINNRKRSADVYPVRTIEFQETIKQKCIERNDSWSLEVLNRISSVLDLPAADAVYHQKCNVNFRTSRQLPRMYSDTYETPPKKSPGRPDCVDINESFNHVISYVKEHEGTILNFGGLVKVMENSCGERAYSKKHLKSKLLDYFGDKISISTLEGKEDKVCLRRTLSNIVYTHSKEECSSEEEKKKNLIQAAAKVIKTEIDSIKQNKDYFPNASSISSTEENKKYLPESLTLLLSSLFSTIDDVKLASIGQAIIQACHPKSTLAPLQLGLGVQLHHQFGSRYLVDLLHKMGFSASYTLVQRYEANAAATLNTNLPDFFPGKFLQFVADNVDHNACTLDGHGTFHGMGIIACTSPGSDVKMAVPKKEISLEDIVALGRISIKYFTHIDSDEPRLMFEDIQTDHLVDERQTKNEHFDLFSKVIWSLNTRRPSWSGFMQLYYSAEEEYPGKTGISFMPMINLNPSDATCINSTLHFVCSQSSKYGVTPVLTFDQPLFQKATNIVSCCTSSDPLKKIVLRLGGFHTEMSFLGSIGHIMSGSGLQESIETVYAPNAVTHMMNGKAVARALRGHFLVDTVLHAMLLSKAVNIDIPAMEEDVGLHTSQTGNSTPGEADAQDSRLTNETGLQRQLSEMYEKLTQKEMSSNEIAQSETLQVVAARIIEEKQKLTHNRTASLWFQYMDMVSILQEFIRAERIGDWNGHLITLSKMLPYFAASGHNLYLKSARIYIQNMLKLEQDHPEVHRQFLMGNHTLRRSERHWAGLSTDLVIEQVLMRSLKSTGGVTRGRGMSETQIAVWLMSLPANAEINNAMQLFTGTAFVTSDQHKDTKPARTTRDDKDTRTILAFMQDHSPFDETDGVLRNIETGVAAGSRVNAEQAKAIGEKIVANMAGQFLDEYSFKRSNQVVTLGDKTSVRIAGEAVAIDPQLLFQRLTAIADRYYEDVSTLFQYELSSVPSSLFDNTGSPRLAQKSQLADAIWKIGDCALDPTENDTDKRKLHVIDGGSLLHRIPWTKNMTFGSIFDLYLNYLTQRYTEPIVVFDGYNDGPSIKDTTHLRRCNGIVGNQVKFGPDTPFKSKKDTFLSNSENKQTFIEQLGSHLFDHGITVRHAPGDADMLIVETAIEFAQQDITYVIGEDTDLLVLLCYHVQHSSNKVYLRSDIRQSRASPKKIWDIQKTQSVLTRNVCDLLPFLHALTGCDSTSRIYGIGKASALKALVGNSDLQEVGKQFMGSRSEKDVGQLGERAIVRLLDGDSCLPLDTLRYHKFTVKVMTGKSFVQVHTLPPTSDAAFFHSQRVYLQSQIWIGNTMLKPEDWGYELTDSKYTPVKCSLPPAPDSLLNVIRCNCKSNCDNKRCTCRKHGLECSLSCGSCRGVGCSNSPTLAELDIDEIV